MTATTENFAQDASPGLSGKVLVSAVLRFLMFPVVIMVPAGTWRWPQAWAIVGIYVAFGIATTLWLYKHDPALLAERSKESLFQEGQKTWDKVFMVLFFILGITMFLTPGFDTRWDWTHVPIALQVVAIALHIPALVWIGRVMKENTFLSKVVKIDKERDHHVITTGPYAWMRHPMYTAMVVLLLAFPIALDSTIALAPAVAMVALLIARTILEDRTLHEELPGYPDYAQKTRYRLVPGIW